MRTAFEDETTEGEEGEEMDHDYARISLELRGRVEWWVEYKMKTRVPGEPGLDDGVRGGGGGGRGVVFGRSWSLSQSGRLPGACLHSRLVCTCFVMPASPANPPDPSTPQLGHATNQQLRDSHSRRTTATLPVCTGSCKYDGGGCRFNL